MSSVTHGQSLLAHSYAQDLCFEVYMASLGKEDAPNREEHIRAARANLVRIAELLGASEHIKLNEAA